MIMIVECMYFSEQDMCFHKHSVEFINSFENDLYKIVWEYEKNFFWKRMPDKNKHTSLCKANPCIAYVQQ